MSNATMPVDEDELKKLLLTLENDIDALGWDQPATLFVIAGTPEDPRFERLADVISGHPCEIMQGLYDSGLRLDERALGLALANEAYRHLHLDELEALDEASALMVSQMLEEASKHFPEMTPEQVRAEAEKVLMKMWMRTNRPSEMPNELRRELRNIMAVFRDGTLAGVWRDRDDEPKLMGFDGERQDASRAGRVPEHMLQLLRCERPQDTDHDDEEG